MTINKRFTQLNNSGSNHNLLDALSGKITGSLEVTGSAYFPGGLSGSLQMLTDGTTMFLTGAGGINITNLANGQIEISGSTAAGAASPEYWDSTTAASIFTTGSVLIRSNDGSLTDSASDYGTDLFFFVSGALSGITNGNGVAAFGGDLVVSGGMRIGDGEGGGLFVSGNIAVGNQGIGASITVETSDQHTDIAINKTDNKSIVIRNNNFSSITDDITISSGTVVIRENYQYGVERPVLTLDANTIAYTVSAGGSADTLGITSAGDITLDATDKIFVTASNGMYVGANTTFNAGLSGSLQEVSAGVPYLLAGDYITIATNSLGQIAISASNLPGSQIYWQSDVANVIYTTGSIEVTGSATFNPAGAGRGLLRVGTLDISPLTGSAITADIAITPYSPSSSLDGNLISSSVGLYANGTPFIMRHEIQMLGLGLDLLGGGYYNVFSATYLVMSFVKPNGVLEVLSATELARDTSGSYAANWDVNFAANGNVEVTGSMGATQVTPEDTIINWYGQVTKEMALTLSGSRS
jgi:hypothetical protein